MKRPAQRGGTETEPEDQWGVKKKRQKRDSPPFLSSLLPPSHLPTNTAQESLHKTLASFEHSVKSTGLQFCAGFPGFTLLQRSLPLSLIEEEDFFFFSHTRVHIKAYNAMRVHNRTESSVRARESRKPAATRAESCHPSFQHWSHNC